MYIRQREPAEIVSKEWKLTIVFLQGLNVVSPDGNGRTGRFMMNQMLLNQGILPAIILNHSKYRQAFRIYERNGGTGLMEYCLVSGIARSYEILEDNCVKLGIFPVFR